MYWVLRTPAKALPNLPPNLALASTQNAEERAPHFSVSITVCSPVSQPSPSAPLVHSTQPFTKTPPQTLYQVAWDEVTSDLHVAKSNGQFSIFTKPDPSAALTPPDSLSLKC